MAPAILQTQPERRPFEIAQTARALQYGTKQPFAFHVRRYNGGGLLVAKNIAGRRGMPDEDGPPGFLEPFGELAGAVAERAHDPRRRRFPQNIRIRLPGAVRKTLQRAGNVADAAIRGPQTDGFDKHVVGRPLRRDLVEPPAELAGIVFQDEPVFFAVRDPVRQSDDLDLRFEGHPAFAEPAQGYKGDAGAGNRSPIGNELVENDPRQLGYRRVRHVGERPAGILPQDMTPHHPYADLEGLVVAPDLRVFGDFIGHIRLREVHILNHFRIAELVTVMEPQQPLWAKSNSSGSMPILSGMVICWNCRLVTLSISG